MNDTMSRSHVFDDINFQTVSPIVCLTASLASWLRRSPREWKIPGSDPACAEIFPGSSHTSDFIIGTPVATL